MVYICFIHLFMYVVSIAQLMVLIIIVHRWLVFFPENNNVQISLIPRPLGADIHAWRGQGGWKMHTVSSRLVLVSL